MNLLGKNQEHHQKAHVQVDRENSVNIWQAFAVLGTKMIRQGVKPPSKSRNIKKLSKVIFWDL